MRDADRGARPWSGLTARPAFRVWQILNLFYLFFVFLPFVFMPEVHAPAVWASVAATALFLPLYLAGHRLEGRARHAVVPLLAALGFALIPINPGGTSFLIYAIAHAAHTLRPRVALATAAALLSLMAVELWWIGEHWVHLAITAVVSGTVAVGTLIGRAGERRQAELRLSQEEVKRLARLAERERIGRDLHDLLGHTLSLIALKSELGGKLLDRDPAAARIEIADVERVAREALGQVRAAVAGIRAAGLEAELARARLALLSGEVDLDGQLDSVGLAPESETALALALREAVTNVLRHARARRVEVALRRDGGWAVLEIRDDGRGGGIRPGHGLSGMRERLLALGGELRIESGSGAGTRLRIRVPAAEAA